MKIQCDVCDKAEASVFCTADEAALCNACDHRVHHANKLASKHQRFSLLLPSAKDSPICDICKEKRAFLFCQQDRAILCRDCDIPIHTANEHTEKHFRYLLTGVKLSATSAVYSPPSAADSVPEFKAQPLINKKSVSVSVSPASSIPSPVPNISSIALAADNKSDGENEFGISEYLMEVCPGWHVEDFLDSSVPPFGFSKSSDEKLPVFNDSSNFTTFSSESSNSGLWVPQSPSTPIYPPPYSSQFGGQIVFNKDMKANRRLAAAEDAFTVPQVSPPSKRSRFLW